MKFLILLIFLFLTACQITKNKIETASYSHYYLWIKSLSNEELIAEINQQNQNIKSGYLKAEINLILLYALPKSPIYNPYTAKTRLNHLSPTLQQTMHISSADFGFITLLREQLNQQIIALNKVVLAEQKQQEQTGLIRAKTQEHFALMEQFLKLNKQLEQLKKIELDLNEQEQ